MANTYPSRRSFLTSSAAALSIPVLARAVQNSSTPYQRPKLKITDIRTAEVLVHGLQTHVRVYTDGGLFGQGEATDASQGTVGVIRLFRRFLIGQDPLNVDLLRTTHRYSRRRSRRQPPLQHHPIPRTLLSWNPSKAALDTANHMIITNDSTAGQMAGVHLDPERGLSIRWRRPETTLDFSALVGGPEDRNIIVPNFNPRSGDRTLWLDEASGRTLAASRVLGSTPAPGNIVTPGFGGRFYYLSAAGVLWELRPRSREEH